MNTVVVTKTDDYPTIERRTKVTLGKPLRWYLSLAGDTQAQVTPLSVSEAADVRAYRYDWMVGLSCVKQEDDWWDWQKALRGEDALKVQLLLKAGGGISWSALSAELLALHPSRDTTSWFEESADQTLKAAGSLAAVGATSVPGLGLGARLLNAIPSTEGKRPWFMRRKKHWYLYRYFDLDGECPAIEWVISKSLVRQYGPLLHGSVALAFHGQAGTDSSVGLRLRAGLGTRMTTGLNYILPGGEKESLLELKVKIERDRLE